MSIRKPKIVSTTGKTVEQIVAREIKRLKMYLTKGVPVDYLPEGRVTFTKTQWRDWLSDWCADFSWNQHCILELNALLASAKWKALAEQFKVKHSRNLVREVELILKEEASNSSGYVFKPQVKVTGHILALHKEGKVRGVELDMDEAMPEVAMAVIKNVGTKYQREWSFLKEGADSFILSDEHSVTSILGKNAMKILKRKLSLLDLDKGKVAFFSDLINVTDEYEDLGAMEQDAVDTFKMVDRINSALIEREYSGKPVRYIDHTAWMEGDGAGSYDRFHKAVEFLLHPDVAKEFECMARLPNKVEYEFGAGRRYIGGIDMKTEEVNPENVVKMFVKELSAVSKVKKSARPGAVFNGDFKPKSFDVFNLEQVMRKLNWKYQRGFKSTRKLSDNKIVEHYIEKDIGWDTPVMGVVSIEGGYLEFN